jgi:hypothetical protein
VSKLLWKYRMMLLLILSLLVVFSVNLYGTVLAVDEYLIEKPYILPAYTRVTLSQGDTVSPASEKPRLRIVMTIYDDDQDTETNFQPIGVYVSKGNSMPIFPYGESITFLEAGEKKVSFNQDVLINPGKIDTLVWILFIPIFTLGLTSTNIAIGYALFTLARYLLP